MINQEIKAKKVLLITEDGNEEMETNKAIVLAEEEGLDLICVNTNGPIPVCKIGDYSKVLYDQKKREKEAKKKQKANQVETKEIRIGDSIEVNDLRIKARQIDKFLSDKNKVKLTIRYRGRAIAHINEGAGKLSKLTDLVSVDYEVEVPAKILGNTVSMTIIPRK